MPAIDERERNPIAVLEKDQRELVLLLARMSALLKTVAQKRQEFRSVRRQDQRSSAEPESGSPASS